MPSLGREEDHREWDAKEGIRPMLEQEVERVLGERGDKEFIFELLCDNEIVEKSRNLSDGSEGKEGLTKLAELIQEKKRTHVSTADKRVCITFLHGIVKEALAGKKDFPNAILYDLSDNRDILNELMTLKEGFANNARGAMLYARLKLWNLLGNIR